MRVILLTLAFSPFRTFKTMVDRVYKTIGLRQVEHYVLNQHYPVDETNNEKAIHDYCKFFAINWVDNNKNLGLADGYNYLINKVQVQDDDVIILLDPDVYPITSGWLDACIKVLQDRRVGWASLMNKIVSKNANQHQQDVISDLRVTVLKHPEMNSICALAGHFIKKVRLHEPKKYYGGLEIAMFHELRKLGYNWVFLNDYIESFDCPSIHGDRIYVIYKWEYAQHNSTDLDFETWRHNYLMENRFYREIHGWFDFEDVYREVVSNAYENSHFVEIGAWLGKSSCYMAHEIKFRHKNIKFDVIDTWDYQGLESKFGVSGEIEKYGSFYNAFISNMKQANVDEIVNPVRLSPLDAAQLYKENSLDFVWLAGGRSYEETISILRAWKPKIKKLGIFGGHNYSSGWADMMRAVNETFGSSVSKISTSSWRILC